MKRLTSTPVRYVGQEGVEVLEVAEVEEVEEVVEVVEVLHPGWPPSPSVLGAVEL